MASEQTAYDATKVEEPKEKIIVMLPPPGETTKVPNATKGEKASPAGKIKEKLAGLKEKISPSQ